METGGNTVFITGGATGIGFSLAQSFLAAGSEVIICGRREGKLAEAKAAFPALRTIVCDVSLESERIALRDKIVSDFPDLNILVNNAGIQKRVDLTKGQADIQAEEDEIEVNLMAPISLSSLFIPHLAKKKESAIMNVSSGLGFVPIASMPIYCATKAALHSITVSLRHQLRGASVKVFELIPPTVDTELDRGARVSYRGIPPAEVAKAAMEGIRRDELEITVGQSIGLRNAEKTGGFEQAFQRMNPD